ncbi:alkaline phosphatase family protein [Aromatoleum diolicum]|uniref:Phosphodiesterase n=1 Tax=Aromatoleum diolicum TaxID=75796 RepID=A0ABX1Q6N1_9RHOO|nr:alkaline phosphatase family protein [Aromatoleum diolicum]NMG73968.1 phosphodiesterase [Aromatoleum diolicum]
MFGLRKPPAPRNTPIPLPRNAVIPDYGSDGLYGLVATIRDYLDGKPWCSPGTSSNDDTREHRPTRKLVFILIDGLGDTFLQRFGAGSTLLAHRQRRLTSVFPSTTASAVTTTLTGLAPTTHGLTGWFIHDRRFGGVIAPLPMIRRAGGPVRGPLALPRLFPYRTLFQRRKRSSIFVSPENLAYSPYSFRHSRGAQVLPYRGIQGMNDAIVTALGAIDGKGGYVHAYYPVFDALSHTHGCTADEVVAQFRRIDTAFAQLLERLRGSGTDVVVSADHGFIDSPPEQQVHLDAYPAVRRLLSAPLFGERRAAFCAVRAGAEGDFQAFADEVLAGKAVLIRSQDLFESGLLGPGKAHRRLSERIGSHTLLMESGWTICDHVPGEHRHSMIGVHGGLSPEEMWVPLICARC